MEEAQGHGARTSKLLTERTQLVNSTAGPLCCEATVVTTEPLCHPLITVHTDHFVLVSLHLTDSAAKQ